MPETRPRRPSWAGSISIPIPWYAPGHRGEGQNHDVYVELAGPSAVDVHHNFVQRWNEASERLAEDGRWGVGSEADLPFPSRVPARRGDAIVQIQRTMHAGRYTDGRPAPEGSLFDIASGERSNFDQYCAAIGAARRSIYIENQYVEVPEIVANLHRALQRGVEVVLLMPAEPEVSARSADRPERRAFLEARAALGAYENFTLAGIAGLGADGRRKPVYVHAKLMLVDDVWATVGSCNLHGFSLFGNGDAERRVLGPGHCARAPLGAFSRSTWIGTPPAWTTAPPSSFSARSPWRIADGSKQAITPGRASPSAWTRPPMGADARS